MHRSPAPVSQPGANPIATTVSPRGLTLLRQSIYEIFQF
ncbi:hypothetical protein Rhow_003750 [Rhodococcus wratislaviensis]|uniref:Uncharacterized protein n=1 Tax=Rhodococcus wratislaviensis TaxID=44752 RepID=A0A402C9C5_RHOWR|nr:hypothetical protein Rhow_003750 [Rhodococcus wratislaviensis]